MDLHLTNLRRIVTISPSIGGFGPGVEVTPYRLTITLSLLILGLAKAIVSYREHIFASITLDLLICTMGVATVYWVGYLENCEPQIWPQFFGKDIFSGRLRRIRRDPEDVVQANNPTELYIIDTPLNTHPGFKVTKHKLCATIAIALAISAKTTYSYRGNLIVATTMDWLIGIPLTILLYWVGLYENVRPAVALEYFHRDMLTGRLIVPDIHPADSLDHAANLETRTKLSSPVRKTLYRLLNTFVLLALGSLKAIMSYLGHSVTPATLEMVVGTFLAIILYWMSFWEPPRARGNGLLFHTDFSRAIPSLGNTLIAIFIVPFMGLHIFGTFSFASGVVTSSEYDNKADKVAKIILCTWWALSLASLLAYLLNRIRERRRISGYERLGFRSAEMLWPLVGWYVANFGVIWVGGLIKATAGNDPSFKAAGGGASPRMSGNGGWHWQVGFGKFSVGGEFGGRDHFVGGLVCS